MYALFVLYRRFGQKINHFITFLILPRLFLNIFRFLYMHQIGFHEYFQEGSHDYCTITQRPPKERKAVYSILLKNYTYNFSQIFSSEFILEFYCNFPFRHSLNNLYIRLEECIRCAPKEDAVYASTRNEKSLIIDSYLES